MDSRETIMGSAAARARRRGGSAHDRRRRAALGAVLLALTGCSGSSAPPAAAPTATTALRTHSPVPKITRSPKPTRTTKPVLKPSRPRPEHYVFPVRGCSASPSASHHDYPASDIFTDKGCAFVAVTSGRVDEVSYVDRWDPSVDAGATRGGLSVSIVGDDGVRYYGSHLESIAPGIHPGVRVRAGELLGRIDNSGDARYTPTHVHFGISWPTRPGIWWVRRGEVWPQRYLAAWRAGEDLSPRAAVIATERHVGKVPPCTVLC